MLTPWISVHAIYNLTRKREIKAFQRGTKRLSNFLSGMEQIQKDQKLKEARVPSPNTTMESLEQQRFPERKFSKIPEAIFEINSLKSDLDKERQKSSELTLKIQKQAEELEIARNTITQMRRQNKHQ